MAPSTLELQGTARVEQGAARCGDCSPGCRNRMIKHSTGHGVPSQIGLREPQTEQGLWAGRFGCCSTPSHPSDSLKIPWLSLGKGTQISVWEVQIPRSQSSTSHLPDIPGKNPWCLDSLRKGTSAWMLFCFEGDQ